MSDDEEEDENLDKYLGFTDNHLLIATNNNIKYLYVDPKHFHEVAGDHAIDNPYELRDPAEDIIFR